MWKKGLYLDIYHSGQRHYDFLKLYLEKGTSSRIVAANREMLELATQTNLTAAESKASSRINDMIWTELCFDITKTTNTVK